MVSSKTRIVRAQAGKTMIAMSLRMSMFMKTARSSYGLAIKKKLWLWSDGSKKQKKELNSCDNGRNGGGQDGGNMLLASLLPRKQSSHKSAGLTDTDWLHKTTVVWLCGT